MVVYHTDMQNPNDRKSNFRDVDINLYSYFRQLRDKRNHGIRLLVSITLYKERIEHPCTSLKCAFLMP